VLDNWAFVLPAQWLIKRRPQAVSSVRGAGAIPRTCLSNSWPRCSL